MNRAKPRAIHKPLISVEEYTDRIAADWPPLDDEGREALARIFGPAVKARASAKKRPTRKRNYGPEQAA